MAVHIENSVCLILVSIAEMLRFKSAFLLHYPARFAERYSTPEADEDGDQSQVTNRAGGRVDGVSKFSYSRACRETNMYDFSLEDTNNYFFFATGVVYVNRYVGMHGMTPRVSPSFVPISCSTYN